METDRNRRTAWAKKEKNCRHNALCSHGFCFESYLWDAENINIRYLHAWFPTWGRALHPTAGPPQPPYPNPTDMTLDEFDHKVKEKQPTRAQHMCRVRLSDRPMPSVQSCYHPLKDLEHSFSLFLVHFSLMNKQKQKEIPFFITSIILHSI